MSRSYTLHSGTIMCLARLAATVPHSTDSPHPSSEHQVEICSHNPGRAGGRASCALLCLCSSAVCATPADPALQHSASIALHFPHFVQTSMCGRGREWSYSFEERKTSHKENWSSDGDRHANIWQSVHRHSNFVHLCRVRTRWHASSGAVAASIFELVAS